MSKKGKVTLRKFQNRFRTDKYCRDYLVMQCWPDGFICPKCGHKHGYRLSNGKYQCTHCHRQTSVTAGTVLHRSHVSLIKWFLAIYFVLQDKRGISATQLANLLGVTYKTAWGILWCLRTAMGQRDPQYFKMGVTKNIKQAFVKRFAKSAIKLGGTIRSDG